MMTKYLAPEQIREATIKAINGLSDLFSILYELQFDDPEGFDSRDYLYLTPETLEDLENIQRQLYELLGYETYRQDLWDRNYIGENSSNPYYDQQNEGNKVNKVEYCSNCCNKCGYCSSGCSC